MLKNTRYWFGIRHVGDSKWIVEPREIAAKEMAFEFVRVLGTISLATRLEVVIARTEDEVIDRLMDRRLGASKNTVQVSDSEWAELEAMFTREEEA